MRKMCMLAPLLLACALLTAIPAQATQPDKAYVYNHSDEAVPIPNPYTVKQVIGGSSANFSSPEDMICRNGYLYVLDSGNRHIDVLDENFALADTIVLSRDGQAYELSDPKGIWIDADNRLFIADKGLKQVVIADIDGRVVSVIDKPETELLTETDDFLPIKVISDHTGLIYILSENEYRGAITVNAAGEFIGFFGSNKVTVTAQVILDQFLRLFMTEEQIARSQKALPMEYSGIAIDSRDFIYACRGTTADMNELIRKLNPQGINVLENKGRFGDSNLGVMRGVWYFTDFKAVAVDERGLMFALDATWNRIFQYSSEGELLYVFGGSGEQEGTFSQVTDIECWGDRVLVLDRGYGTVTVFEPTTFGTAVRNAQLLYEEGNFEQSIQPWQEVIRQNSNYEFAYTGIGKALYVMGQYKEAMRYFRLGYSHRNYSLAFKRYRTQVLRANFTTIAIVLGALLILVPLGIRLLRKKRAGGPGLDRNGRLRYVGYILLHPGEGFEELRYNGKSSLLIANVVLVLLLFGSALNYQYEGFIFNYRDAQDFNIFITMLSTLGVFAGWAIANWLLATFLEGKGGLKGTWICSAYALIPYVAYLFIETLMSNFMSLDEGVFISYLGAAALLWSAVLLFSAVKGLHQYTMKVNIASIVLTVLGILIIVFLIFLMYSLYMQLASFVTTIFSEALYRIQSGR